MSRSNRPFAVCLVLLMLVLWAGIVPVSAFEVTVEGEINEVYQLVTTAGDFYEVAINDPGNELVENQIGQKVRVLGAVQTDADGTRIITVTTYEVLAE